MPDPNTATPWLQYGALGLLALVLLGLGYGAKAGGAALFQLGTSLVTELRSLRESFVALTSSETASRDKLRDDIVRAVQDEGREVRDHVTKTITGRAA